MEVFLIAFVVFSGISILINVLSLAFAVFPIEIGPKAISIAAIIRVCFLGWALVLLSKGV